MALSGISLGSAASIQSNPQTDPRLLFMQLTKAVSSGDLSGAQQAYAQLTQALGNTSGGTSNSSDPFSQALNTIGQALQNGDIGGAQQALTTLQQQMQAGRGQHRHGHHHGSGGTGGAAGNAMTNATPTVTATSGTSGNTLDVTA